LLFFKLLLYMIFGVERYFLINGNYIEYVYYHYNLEDKHIPPQVC
jgi:Uma2 family endonuclease